MAVEPPFAVTRERLDLDRLVRAVVSAEPRGRDGALVTFLGLVRSENLGRHVRHLEYEAYEPLALRAFDRIAGEIHEEWPGVRLALHHRIGRLELGEASVAIVTAAPHRAEAFAACRYAIERVKQIVPIWKHEFFEQGDAWIEGAMADPEDAGARERALQRTRACV